MLFFSIISDQESIFFFEITNNRVILMLTPLVFDNAIKIIEAKRKRFFAHVKPESYFTTILHIFFRNSCILFATQN